MNETQVEILTTEERLRHKLARLVHRVIPPSASFVQGILLREIGRATPATLEKIRREILELVT